MAEIKGKQLKDASLDVTKLTGVAADVAAGKFLLTGSSQATQALSLDGDLSQSISGSTIALDVAAGAIDLTKLSPSALVLESSGISSNDTDNALPTAAAVKDYVDTSISSSAASLNFTGDSGTDSLSLATDTLSFTGDANITTAVTNNQLSTTLKSHISITSATLSGDLLVGGDLTVNGTTTTVNSTTVTVDDKNLELGSVATPTDVTADGGGITLKGATDKTFNWVNANDSWTSSEHINLAAAKEYKIGTASVLTTDGAAKVQPAVAGNGLSHDGNGAISVDLDLDGLTDVTITSATNGQVISYNSTSGEWENSTPSSGATELNALTDVTITTPTSGQILKNNGSGQFVNTSLSIVDDTSPQLGGNLNTSGFAIDGNLTPSTTNAKKLGSSSKTWSDLYIGDSGNIFFGEDQDVHLIHDPDNGLRLDLGIAESSHDPQLELRSQNSGTVGPRIKLNHESPNPAAGNRIGSILFNGEDSGGTTQEYSIIQGKIIDPAAGAEAGSISIMAHPSMVNNRGLHVEGIAGQASQVKVNIDHDGGNYGLHLNNTLVTTTAAELNLLDGNSTVGSSITITDTDGFVINDGGTTKLIPASDIKTYAASAVSGISAVLDDTTPQLGGALDVNGNAITSASNGNVAINPDGTGDISVGADIIPDTDATHTIGDEDNRFISLYSDVNGAIRFKAKNDQGSAITKGQVVYIKGISGDVPTVGLARANSASTMPGFGLALANANDQAEVQIITFGNLTEYDTTTYSLSAGDTVYVSAATAGALTNSAPASETNLIQNIGKVVRASATEGIIKVGGAGRSAATPNLDNGKIFLGNASNQAVSTALSSAAVTSFNTQTGALTIGGNDLTADHTAVYYTAANANIDGHLSGIDDELALKAPLASPSLTGTPTAPTATQGDNSTQLATTAYVDTALASGSGSTHDPSLVLVSSASYDMASLLSGGGLSATQIKGLNVWYSGTGATFTVTLPDIATVGAGTASVGGNPADTFEIYVGRGSAGDIVLQSTEGIDATGDGSVSFTPTSFTLGGRQFLKVIAWRSTSNNAQYIVESAGVSDLDGLTDVTITAAATGEVLRYNGANWVDAQLSYNDLSNTPTLPSSSDDLTSDHTGTNYTGANTDTVTVHLSGIDSELNNRADTVNSVAVSNGAVTIDGDDIIAPRTGTYYTAANTDSITTHLAGIDTALASAGGASNLNGLSDVTITAAATGEILRYNGTNWVDAPLSIIDDPSPQLGGDLDLNSNGISSNLVPATANNRSLGSSSAEWSDLYIGDNGKIFFGNDQDVELIHDPDDGLILDLSVTEASNDPQFELRSQNSGTIGPRLKFNHESPNPAAGNRIGIISFTGKDSGGTEQEYSKIQGMITDTTAGAEVGRISILATPGISNTRGLHVEGVSGQTGYTKVNIDHDGNNYGLHLNNTLVTARATELNLLDSRNSTVGSSITIVDTDGVIVNDGGTSKLVPASDFKTYIGVSSGGGFTYSEVTSATSAQVGYHYSCGAGNQTFTVTLPAASGASGQVSIKNMGTGTITIGRTGGDTIDGAASDYTVATQYAAVTLISNESNGWEII